MGVDVKIRSGLLQDERFLAGESGTETMSLPPVGAIGFIPWERQFHPPPGDVFTEDSHYHLHSSEQSGISRHTFCKLFATGSEVGSEEVWGVPGRLPPSDPEWFRSISARQMRGVVALTNLVAHLNDGIVVGVEGHAYVRVGGTPAGLRAFTLHGFQRPRVCHLGTGHVGGRTLRRCPKIEQVDGSQVLTHGVGLKIGAIGNLLGRAVIAGAWAPTAFVEIGLRFKTVRGRISYEGFVVPSAIPSVHAWVGDRDVLVDMCLNSPDEIDGFMTAVDGLFGSSQVAPEKVHSSIGLDA